MVLETFHHLFIQSCMSRRVISDKTAKILYAKCLKICDVRSSDTPDFATALASMREAIGAFGFDIKTSVDEHSGRPWLAFVNTKDDELAKVATEYGPQEISYFRTLVKKIMRSGKRYAITEMDAKRAGNDETVTPKLTPASAEAVLENFVARGWLVVLKAQIDRKQTTVYQLSTRARVELDDYLHFEYPNSTDKAYECTICSEIVMKGYQCGTENCKTRMHDHCSRTWFIRSDDKKCPSCKGEWSEHRIKTIGPEAKDTIDTETDASSSDIEQDQEEQRAEFERPQRKQARRPAKAESDEDELESNQSEAERPSRRPKRPRE